MKPGVLHRLRRGGERRRRRRRARARPVATRRTRGAEVDCNVVMTGSGALVEVQGTAEGEPFSRAELDALLDLAERGITAAHAGSSATRSA